MDGCIFCGIVAGSIPSTQVHADDDVVVFMDINPVARGHCLVVPREHRPTVYELADDEGAAVMRAAGLVARAIRDALRPDGLNLHQSNGAAAGQVVGHFHLHVIPRWEGDGASLGWRPDPGGAGGVGEAAAAIRAVLGGSGA